ncbi:hypothetical protein HanXRQr2_Chr14g0637681 [Helianthus annuus]|uniref:Uncharacterized protein n=1 Tax=Helianthus annuus TaxID=4232 RepID=A0A9K3E7T5_HELAN|nr:hypothetical protein HanXRQr2_Chr14g0637681 [Helianthus annuus]KAJ0839846.1 hypothetical protein HanPSC8_Chr14g0611641 [Helianthus annuus]
MLFAISFSVKYLPFSSKNVRKCDKRSCEDETFPSSSSILLALIIIMSSVLMAFAALFAL